MVARDVPPAGVNSAAPRTLRPRRPALAGAAARSRSARAASSGRWSALARRGARATIAPTRARTSSAPAAGGSAARTGRGRRTGSRCGRRGRVTRVRAYYVWSPDRAGARARRLDRRLAADPLAAALGRERADPPRRTELRRRACASPSSTTPPGSNSYTRAQSASIVRGIQRYHVLGNGWDDIGYNFLVDKYGQIFEGRFGGVDRNVVGAHAQGFNTGSVGVALIGNYDATRRQPPREQRARRASSRGGSTSRTSIRSRASTGARRGNPRFPAGRAVTLRTISGHRDTGFTTCPGQPALRRARRDRARRSRDRACRSSTRRVRSARPAAGALHRDAYRALPGRWSSPSRAGTSSRRAKASGTDVDWTWDARTVPAGPLPVRDRRRALRAARNRASSPAAPPRPR